MPTMARPWRHAAFAATIVLFCFKYIAAQSSANEQANTTAQAVAVAASSGDAQAVAVAISVAFVCVGILNILLHARDA